jgi:hypothetical protein
VIGSETSFYTTVHRYLPVRLHREKMHNAYRSGTADVWYSGPTGDLWVEYKFVRTVPTRAPIRVYQLLTPLQLKWLNDRHAEGRNVAVVLGTTLGAWIFEHGAWLSTDVTRLQLQTRGLERKDVADFIRRKTCAHEPSKGAADDG